MTEKERIESIKHIGGFHLKDFKPEKITYKMCLAAVQSDGLALRYVPMQFRTDEVCHAACTQNGYALQYVPNSLYCQELFEVSVKSSGIALQFVPPTFVTKELCLLAASNTPNAYLFIPIDYITPGFVVSAAHACGYDSISKLPDSLKNNQFYLELISVDPEFIWYIPRKALTAKLGRATIKSMGYSKTADAVKSNPKLLSRLHTSLYDHETCLNFVQSEYFKTSHGRDKFGNKRSGADEEKGRMYLDQSYDETYSLPDMMRWTDVAIQILRINGNWLKFVNPEILTEELCKVAISSNAYSFSLVPKELRTKALCMFAFEKTAFNIMYFPEQYITEALAINAVKHSGYILKYLPEKFRTREVCMIAVSDEGHGRLDEVPASVIDKEICLKWLRSSKNVAISPLDLIPDDLKDYDIYYAVAVLDHNELSRVPPEFIDEKMCLAAIKKSYHAAKYIPQHLFTKEMATILTSQTSLYFDRIPTELLTEEMCINAIRHGECFSGTVLEDVPDELKTQKMCDIAVDVSIWSLAAVPDRYVSFEMLVKVAMDAPGRLQDNFPKRYRNKITIDKMLDLAPRAEDYLMKLLESD